mmetsp:Transcript_14498/g.22506  ORF Transcript_14498/g.22506 Transcript_14498/m.22506 type:complete len:197 (+) Transcript_14498:249-839(+)|eukprot:CAMPEP_0184328270 /NCGR_PEP_ID=MMETSP1049-20130417/143534_1 /TAXON_ID=77928 /ORGANISM="Proteomonas sulcata, Strain CCMP704" /LENGTH=196 /DNA_ID=CAMNT_0026650573 /DNA_START=145 /DNA_END=735 /DNA_ORIENTATION=+
MMRNLRLVALVALVFVPLASSFSISTSSYRLAAQSSRVPSLSTKPPSAAIARRGEALTELKMGMDVAPSVVAAFPTAPEQNEVLAIVNEAMAELNRNKKSLDGVGKAATCTYILAAGRPRQGVISVRFSCKFQKQSSDMTPGFVPGFGGGGSRGAQIAQVSVEASGKNVQTLTVDIDGGWGRKLLIKGNFGGANKW